MNDDLPDLKGKNYMQHQFEKRCLKQFANFASGYDPQRKFPKKIGQEVKCVICVVYLSSFSNPL